MNWFVLIVAVVVSVSAKTPHGKSKCTKNLQRIVSESGTFAETYLSNINRALRLQSPLLFGPQADSVVSQFENQYGVTVELGSPFSPFPSAAQTCDSVNTTVTGADQNLQANTIKNFALEINSTGTVSQISLSSLQIACNGVGVSNVNLTLIAPDSSTQAIAFDADCAEEQLFANIIDGSTSDICANINSTSASVPPAEPFSIFTGLDVNGNWTLSVGTSDGAGECSITGWGLTYCTGEPTSIYPYNIAKSNLGVQGFRYDSGNNNFYYTTVMFNANGEALYVTIIKSAVGMIN